MWFILGCLSKLEKKLHSRSAEPQKFRSVPHVIISNTHVVCSCGGWSVAYERGYIPSPSGGSWNKAMGGGGGRLYWRGGIFWSALLSPPPPQGRRKDIIKFMNFNGGICSPYSFRPPGGGKKLHRAVFYGDRSKLFWMSLYTRYIRERSRSSLVPRPWFPQLRVDYITATWR